MTKFNTRVIQALELVFNIKQLNKRNKNMNKIKKTFAIALTVSALIFNPVSQASAHNNDSVAQLNASQARGVARQYLNTLGFSRLGTSQSTALVGEAELIDNTWVINVRYDGRMTNKSAIVYVDDATGQIKENTN